MLAQKEKLIFLLIFLKLTDALPDARENNEKKVRFFKVSEDSSYSSGNDFIIKSDKEKGRKSTKFLSSFSDSSVSTTGDKKKKFTSAPSISPNRVIHKAADKGKNKNVPVITKSILKNASKINFIKKEEDVVIFKKENVDSPYTNSIKSTERRVNEENNSKNQENQEKAFIKSRFDPNASDETTEEDDFSYLNQNTGDPYRQIGPTPQYINDIGPERFWLPPNAPIQNSASFLQFLPGIAGANPIGNLGAQAQDANSPQIVGITRPRDRGFIADPITPDEIANQEFQTFLPLTPTVYSPPCDFPPLNPITPIPGGNIVDPLSPQVQNINGPYYPNDPTNDGAYLMTANVPEPQLVARNIDDGPYIVEPVVDPIVYFDPANNRTLVFNPQTNAVRLFDPETDPELPITQTVNMVNNQNDVNGGLLKVSKVNFPAFWIMKRRSSNNSGLEKAAKQADKNINGRNTLTLLEINSTPQRITNGVNGNIDFNIAKTSSNNNGKNNNINGNNMDVNINEPIQKSQNQPNGQQNQELHPDFLQMQEKSPNNPLEKRTLKIQQSINQENHSTNTNANSLSKSNQPPVQKSSNYVVTIVYKADTDFNTEKRYKGFKQNQNSYAHTVTSDWKISLVAISIMLMITMMF